MPLCATAMTVTAVDLSAPGSTKSIASYINSEGDVAGIEFYPAGSHAFFYSGLLGTVTDLGTFGGDTSYPMGLNAFGDVSGTAYGNGTNLPQGFIYHNGTMTNIGGIGGTITFGNSLNDAGTVVGSGDLLNNSGSHAILSASPHASTPTDIGTLGGSQGEADFINNNGQIAGSANTGGDSGRLAFYSLNGSTLVSLSLGGNNSAPKGMNSSGQVIGFSTFGSGSLQHGFIYDPGTTAILNLGTLTALSGQNPYNGNSQALAVNDSGEVVGYSEVATNTKHAFACTFATTPVNSCVLTDLGALGFTNSVANAINSSGEIVGTLSTGPVTDAFVYIAGQMIDLNSILPADSTFKSLNTAVGVNDSGQIIGQGTLKSGINAAYVLTISGQISAVPEPSSGVYLGLGLLLAAVARKRGGVRVDDKLGSMRLTGTQC